MFDFFHRIMDEAVAFLKTEEAKWKKVVFLLFLLLFAVLVIWGYNKINFLDKIDKRIDTLDKLTKLDMVVIESNDLMKEEYNRILEDISHESKGIDITTYTKVLFKQDTTEVEYWMKFATGGLWFFLISLFSIQIWKEPLAILVGFIICIIFGSLFGYLATLLPTFRNIYINYIGFPILLIILMYIIYRISESKN